MVCPLLVAHSKADAHHDRRGLEPKLLQQHQVVAVAGGATLHLVVDGLGACVAAGNKKGFREMPPWKMCVPAP